jgi:hypothetical protein
MHHYIISSIRAVHLSAMHLLYILGSIKAAHLYLSTLKVVHRQVALVQIGTKAYTCLNDPVTVARLNSLAGKSSE